MPKYLSVLAAAIILLAGMACTQTVTPTTVPAVAPPTAAGAVTPAATKPASVTTAPPKPAATSESRPAAGVPFYQGKTVEVISASPAGGGTDTMARIIAAYLPKYIPGNPRMVIRNQPGAQGAMGANIFVEKAKPDGLTWMMNSTGAMSLQLKKESIVKYDLLKIKHVGSVARAESVVMIGKGLKPRLLDPKAAPVVVGTGEGAETWNAVTLWGKEFLGWNVRWVSGFGGTGEMELPFRRHEIDMFGTSNAYVIRRLIQEGLADPVASIGTYQGGKFVRRPDFPDVPTFEEVLGDKKPSGLPWQGFLVWIGPTMIDKFLSIPMETPDNVYAILTDGFAKMAKDPDFDSVTRKTVSEVYSVSIGKEIDSLMRDVLTAPPEAVQYGKDLQIKTGIISR